MGNSVSLHAGCASTPCLWNVIFEADSRDIFEQLWHCSWMKPIRLPDDERASSIRKLIDPCEFASVRRYVESQTSEIEAAFVVDASITLEQVAVVVASGEAETMTQLMQTGLVKQVDDLNLIADDVRCRVIYIPPAYLVQFTGH